MEQKLKWDKVFLILAAFVSTIAIEYCFNLLSGLVDKVQLFSPNYSIDIIVLIPILYFNFFFFKKYKFNRMIYCASFILALLIFFGVSSHLTGSSKYVCDSKLQLLWIVSLSLGLALEIHNILIVMEDGFAGLCINTNEIRISDKLFLSISCIVIFAGWMLIILLCYPGELSSGALTQIWQVTGVWSWNDHHPVLSTVILGGCYYLGAALWNDEFGIFLFLFVQAVLAAFVFGNVVLRVKQKTKSLAISLSVLFYFAISPQWWGGFQYFEKDMLYTIFAVWSVLILYDVLQNDSFGFKEIFSLVLVTTITCLIRNNGIYVMLPALICLVIFCKDKKKSICSALLICILYFGVKNGLYPALNITGGSVGEAFSIPFQQTAYYMKEYPEDVTDEEWNAINGVLDADSIGDAYDWEISNPVKNTFKADGDMKEYLACWIKMFFKHPGPYFQAFLNCAHAYVVPCESGTVTMGYGCGDSELPLERSFPKIYMGMKYLFNIFKQMPVTRLLFCSATYVWTMAFLMYLSIKNKMNRKWIVIFVPGILTFFICIASPVPSLIRYASVICMTLPLLMCVAYDSVIMNKPELKKD